MIKKKGFNLLKNQVEPQTVWSKLYNWTTNTARAILVIVELVIVLAFGARVVVDLQFKNLNKDIEAREDVLLLLQDTEREMRSIQEKVSAYNLIWTNTNYNTSVLDEVIAYIPPSVDDLSVQLSDEELIIRGFATPEIIASIENSFKTSDSFTRTELINVETQGSTLDSFTLRTQLNNPPTRGDKI